MAAILGLTAMAMPALALRLPPVTHPATLKECSGCHMVFPPQMLPARSWTALMGDLANHFNESAALPPDVQADIVGYLTANAADAPANKAIRGLLSGVKATDVPLRITEMPWWKRSHGEVSPGRYALPQIKTASNCIACHRDGAKGVFTEN
ncbi:MAG: diheme cytochrome c [Rhizobiales bacterium]|nr:diheme cytochrome c [Hyphomicrobiales bacterium]